MEASRSSSSPELWLPDDVAISWLARASRMEHAALSVASKSYRDLVASPDLYKVRSLMARTETYVYVCLRTPPGLNPRWYILRRRKNLDGSHLIAIPSCPSQPPEASSVVVLDCRTHTWRHVPSMGVARAYAAAGVVDGKIYVLGGCQVDETWGEVFDPKTQTWDTLPPMLRPKRRDAHIHSSVDETDRTFYCSPSQGQWGRGNQGQVMGNRRDFCMIDNLLYCCSRNGNIFWCEPDELDWREPEGMMDTKLVKGLGSLNNSLRCSRLVHFGEQMVDHWNQLKIKFGITQTPESDLVDVLPGARLTNSGGNIVLFWDVIEGDRLEIWCAEISLERRQGPEMWGNIEWSNVVMTVDPFLHRYKVPPVKETAILLLSK